MTHRNAVLTPQGRYRLVMRVQAGHPIAHVVAEAGIARATGSLVTAKEESRSLKTVPAPRFTAPPAPVPRRWTSSSTGAAPTSGPPVVSATSSPRAGQWCRCAPVTRWLDRAGLNRRRDIDPTGQTNRTGKPILARFPGHMIHLDVKKVGRIPPGGGWRAHGRGTPKGQSLQTRQRSQDRLHLPAHRHRQLLASGLHRGPRRMRWTPPRSVSSAAPGPSSPPTASPGSCGSLPTTGPTTAPGPSPRPSPPWLHATRGSAPTPHVITARSSATTASWPRSASTRVPTPQSSSAVTPSRCGTTTTTTIDPTPPATTSHPPPASQHTSPTS